METPPEVFFAVPAEIVFPEVLPIATAASTLLTPNIITIEPTTAFRVLLLLCFLCALVNSETATQA